MGEVASRRGALPGPLVASALVGFGVMVFRLEPMRLARAFFDLGWDGYRPWWIGAVVLVVAGMLGVLASVRVPAMLGRHCAGGAFWLLSVAVAVAEISDPATALAVGGCVGVLAAVAGWVAFGVEGEGGVVWLGAIAAGLGGVVFAAFVGGVLNELAEGGAVWASVAGEFFGLGAMGVAGAVPAAGVLFVQKRLEPYDRVLLNALAGVVCGALIGASVRS